jgi:hypothetical protein
MATALQCPDCGCKHRLDAVGDRAVFSCSRCGRQLKVPDQYRRVPDAARNGSSGRAAASTNGAPRSGAPATKAPRRFGAAPMRLPVRILLWVVAFVIAALVVRFIAKLTGFAGGDTFFDLLIDGSVGTYLRLFSLVPVWALLATLLATVFIDGPGWWAHRMGTASARPAPGRAPKPSARPKMPTSSSAAATLRRTAAASCAAAGVAGAAGAAACATAARTIPRRERPAPSSGSGPAPRAAAPPLAEHTEGAPLAPVGAEAGDDAADFAARAQAGQRPRRIPRRGAGE